MLWTVQKSALNNEKKCYLKYFKDKKTKIKYFVRTKMEKNKFAAMETKKSVKL